MITRSKRAFRCMACKKPMEIDVMHFDHPDASDMMLTSGWIGVTPDEENDTAGKITVAIVCSEQCCVTYLERGAEGLADAVPPTLRN